MIHELLSNEEGENTGTYVCVHMCMYACTRMRARTHTHTHTQMYAWDQFCEMSV